MSEQSNTTVNQQEVNTGDGAVSIQDPNNGVSGATNPQANLGNSTDPEDTIQKPDFVETRLSNINVKTDDLFALYGTDGFGKIKSFDTYWENEQLQEHFIDRYGATGKAEFKDLYDTFSSEYSAYKQGSFTKSESSFQLAISDASKITSTITNRIATATGNIKHGGEWSSDVWDIKEGFQTIRKSTLNDDGTVSHDFYDVNDDSMAKLDEVEGYAGLAYSDASLALIDREKGFAGSYFDAIVDGKIFDDISGEFIDARNDQIASGWDLDTGFFGDTFRRNKLELSGVADYLAVPFQTVFNTAMDFADTPIQLLRASIGGTISIGNLATGEGVHAKKLASYRFLTNVGIGLKSNKFSRTRESLDDGIWGSFEAQLDAVFTVAAQIGAARILGVVGKGAGKLFNSGVKSEAAMATIQQSYANRAVRGTLTAMTAKDIYNEGQEVGFSEGEAALLTAVSVVALWHATSLAGYITGDYRMKLARKKITEYVIKFEAAMLKKGFNSIDNAVVDKVVKEGVKQYSKRAKKAIFAYNRLSEGIGKIIKGTKTLPKYAGVYEARQEALEEMTEELAQDIVKQVSVGYGHYFKKEYERGGKGFRSVFSKGYFKDAFYRYIETGAMGAIGGPMGMIGSKFKLNDINNIESLADIVITGNETVLKEVLDAKLAAGELGPLDLSTNFDEVTQTFKPLIEGSTDMSLGQMTYNLYMKDLNVMKTTLTSPAFQKAASNIMNDSKARTDMDNRSMRNDFAVLIGRMMRFHQKTGMGLNVYTELDQMPAHQKAKQLKELAGKLETKIEDTKATIENLQNEINGISEEAKDELLIKRREEALAEKTMLEESIQLSGEVTQEEINQFYEDYRRLKAIENGSISEHYLLRNLMDDDTTFGDMSIRGDAFKSLGENAFMDTMFKIRERGLMDKKEYLLSIRKALEVEKEITAITGTTEEDIDKIVALIKANPNRLSKKSLEHIASLVDESQFAGMVQGYGENSPEWKDGSGAFDDAGMFKAYLTILKLNPGNKLLRYEDEIKDGVTEEEHINKLAERNALIESFRDGGFHKDFFNSLENNIHKTGVGSYYYGENPERYNRLTNEYEDMGSGPQLLPGSEILFSDIVKVYSKNFDSELTKNINYKLIELYRTGVDAARELKRADGAYIDPDRPYSYDLSVIFNSENKSEYTAQELIHRGLSEVTQLVDTMMGDRFTKKNSTELKEVKAQMVIKEKVASMFHSFLSDGALHNTLGQFRKNVIDIIDGSYKIGEEVETIRERHAYKDYTAFSDNFVDFIGDPITILETDHTKTDNLTNKELLIRDKLSTVTKALSAHIVKKNDNGPDSADGVKIDFSLLALDLNKEFGDLNGKNSLNRAIKFFSIDGSILEVNGKTVGKDTETEELIMTGITRLKASEWLIDKAIGIIAEVQDTSTPLPYIQNKHDEIDSTYKVYNDLLSDTFFIKNKALEPLKRHIEQEVPEFMTLGIDEKLSPSQYIELGKALIKVEKIFYDFYSGDLDVSKEASSADKATMKGYIDTYIKESLVINIKRAPTKKALKKDKSNLQTLVLAISANMSPFYSKMKGIVESEEDVDLPIAGQEAAAKVVAAYIYDKGFRKYVDALDFSFTGVYVDGTAGSGKTTVTTELGIGIGLSILGDLGETNVSVLGVSNSPTQAIRIHKSIGVHAGDTKPVVVTSEKGASLIKLLEDAVSGDDKAIEAVNKLAAIVIDEVTYVAFDNKLTHDERPLNKIQNLLKAFNDKHKGADSVVLVVLGDSKQSGALVDEGSEVYSAALQSKDAFGPAYLDFSFRNRNSFLTDSLKAIRSLGVRAGFIKGVAPEGLIPRGVKYGTSEGVYYGMNIQESKDRDTMTDMIAVLDDPAFLQNMEENLAKAKASGKKFTVGIIVENMSEYDNAELKGFKALVEKYKAEISIYSYDDYGGAEHNYIIGEFPHAYYDKYSTSDGKTREIFKGLNTLATRAINYVHIINKNKEVYQTEDTKTEHMPDGSVRIPESDLDGKAKGEVKKVYLGIYEDVDSSDIIKNKNTPTNNTEITSNTDGFSGLFRTIFMSDGALMSPTTIDKSYRLLNEGRRSSIKSLIDELYRSANGKIPVDYDVIDTFVDGEYADILTEQDITDIYTLADMLDILAKDQDLPGASILLSYLNGKLALNVNKINEIDNEAEVGFLDNTLADGVLTYKAVFIASKAEISTLMSTKDIGLLKDAKELFGRQSYLKIKPTGQLSLFEDIVNPYSEPSDIEIFDKVIAIVKGIVESSSGSNDVSKENSEDMAKLFDIVMDNFISSVLAYDTTIEPEPLPKLVMGSPRLTQFATTLQTLTIEELTALKDEILKISDSTESINTFSDEMSSEVSDLFKDYEFLTTKAGILNTIAATIRKKKSNDESEEVELLLLRDKLGFDKRVKNPERLAEFYREASIQLNEDIMKGDSADFITKIEDLTRFRELLIRLHNVKDVPPVLNKFKNVGGRYYYVRPEGGDTQQQYKDTADDIMLKNEVFTMPLGKMFRNGEFIVTTKFINSFLTDKLGIIPVEAEEGFRIVNGLVEGNPISSVTYSLVAIRQQYKKKEFIMYVIVADVDGAKYAVGQLQDNADHPKINIIKNKVEMLFANEEVDIKSDNGEFSAISTLIGESKKAVIIRAGKIDEVVDENDIPLTIDDLERNHTVTVSEGGYIQTAISNNAGGMFVIYSTAKDVDLESKEVRDQILDDNVLDRNITLKVNNKNFVNHIGLIPITFKPPFLFIHKYLDGNPKRSIEDFPSLYSYVMLALVAKYAKTNPEYSDSTYARFNQPFFELINDIDVYLSNTPKELKDDIDKSLKFVEEGAIRNNMEGIMKEIISLTYNDVVKKSTTTIISRKKMEDGDRFVFKLSILMQAIPDIKAFEDSGAAKAMDFVMKATRFSLPVPKATTFASKTKIVGADKDFVSFFKTYAFTNVKRIKPPLPAITANGYASFLSNVGKSGDTKGPGASTIVILDEIEEVASDLTTYINKVIKGDSHESTVSSINNAIKDIDGYISYHRKYGDVTKDSGRVIQALLNAQKSLDLLYELYAPHDAFLTAAVFEAKDVKFVNELVLYSRSLEGIGNNFSSDDIMEVVSTTAILDDVVELEAELSQNFNSIVTNSLLSIILNCK